jgi:hypothetical protein
MSSPGREEIVMEDHTLFCARFNIFITMAMMNTASWNVTSCNLVACPDDASSMFFQNFGHFGPQFITFHIILKS